MIEHSTSIVALSKALHGVQGVLTGVKKDQRNPHFKNRYASLEAVFDTARPALQEHGLCVTQAPGSLVDGAVEITTMLMHTSGEWMRSTLHMPVVKRDPQGVGSAISYGLRYALLAVLGVPPTDDDDGEAAMPSRQIERPPPQTTNTDTHTSIRPPAPRTNGHSNGHDWEPPAETASKKIAREMSAKLWKVAGDQAVDELRNDPEFKKLFRALDTADAEQVGNLIRERRAAQ